MSESEALPSPAGRRIAVEIVCVGRDLLRGYVSESNVAALAGELAACGAPVRRTVTVEDDTQAIRDEVAGALARGRELVVVCGGLGPAGDDRTYEAVAEALHVPLQPTPETRRAIDAAYQRLARSRKLKTIGMTLEREKLCRLPVGATPIPSPEGVAVGAVCKVAGGQAVVCLPGRPRDCRAVWTAAREELRELLPKAVRIERKVEAPTRDEAELKPLLEQLGREHPGVWMSTVPPASSFGNADVLVLLEATAKDGPVATTRVEAAVARLLALAAERR